MSAVEVAARPGSIEARLFEAGRWLAETVPSSELAAAFNEVKMMGEWLRVAKAAEDLRKRALELEYIALRKIGNTEFVTDLPNTHLRPASRWLAGLSEDTFEKLLDSIGCDYSPIAAYRAHLARQRRKEEEERLAHIGSGSMDARLAWGPSDGQRLRSAATTILDQMVSDGVPFKISEVALRLADELEIDGRGLTRQEIGEALRGVVTASVREVGDVKDILIDGGVVGFPQLITVYEDEFGWVRVPFFNASLAQLQAMAEDHEARAADYVARAAELTKLAEHFANFGEPNENLSVIESRARNRRNNSETNGEEK